MSAVFKECIYIYMLHMTIYNYENNKSSGQSLSAFDLVGQ